MADSTNLKNVNSDNNCDSVINNLSQKLNEATLSSGEGNANDYSKTDHSICFDTPDNSEYNWDNFNVTNDPELPTDKIDDEDIIITSTRPERKKLPSRKVIENNNNNSHESVDRPPKNLANKAKTKTRKVLQVNFPASDYKDVAARYFNKIRAYEANEKVLNRLLSENNNKINEQESIIQEKNTEIIDKNDKIADLEIKVNQLETQLAEINKSNETKSPEMLATEQPTIDPHFECKVEFNELFDELVELRKSNDKTHDDYTKMASELNSTKSKISTLKSDVEKYMTLYEAASKFNLRLANYALVGDSNAGLISLHMDVPERNYKPTMNFKQLFKFLNDPLNKGIQVMEIFIGTNEVRYNDHRHPRDIVEYLLELLLEYHYRNRESKIVLNTIPKHAVPVVNDRIIEFNCFLDILSKDSPFHFQDNGILFRTNCLKDDGIHINPETAKKMANTIIESTIDFLIPDSSDVYISAILNQNGRPVAFMSRSLQGGEIHHPSMQKEAASIMEAVVFIFYNKKKLR